MSPRLDHWHPVCRSADLRRAPIRVTLDGVDLVLFRTAGGVVGALPDACPHRRMRLSEGRVDGETIVCPYHGWRYTPAGEGRSPGNPRLDLRTPCYEAVERHGAVWIRTAGSDTAFPTPDVDGFRPVALLRHRIRAPLPVVLDNFVEVEHTPSVHALLGYEAERMHEVRVTVEPGPDSVRVVNEGPQKPLPSPVRALFGLRSGDTFVDEWTTWFSPVYTVYDHWWKDPTTGRQRGDRLRTAVFFNPIRDAETELWSFVYTTATPFGRLGLNLLARPILARLVDLEVERDRRIVERLADAGSDLRGMKLGRFDRVLGENRRRLDALYDRGRSRSRSTDPSGVR